MYMLTKDLKLFDNSHLLREFKCFLNQVLTYLTENASKSRRKT